LPILDLARHIGDVAVARRHGRGRRSAARPDIAAWCRMRGHENVGESARRRHGPPTRCGACIAWARVRTDRIPVGERCAASVKADIEESLVCMRPRGPDESVCGPTTTPRSGSGGWRSSTSTCRTSHSLPGRALHLIFNGEIYNYLELRERLTKEFGATFEDRRDSEAIVAATTTWARTSSELRGMFAFLIWDAQERVLSGA